MPRRRVVNFCRSKTHSQPLSQSRRSVNGVRTASSAKMMARSRMGVGVTSQHPGRMKPARVDGEELWLSHEGFWCAPGQ